MTRVLLRSRRAPHNTMLGDLRQFGPEPSPLKRWIRAGWDVEFALPHPNICPDCFHEECEELGKAYLLLKAHYEKEMQ